MSHVLLGFMVSFDTLPTCSETKTGPRKALVSSNSRKFVETLMNLHYALIQCCLGSQGVYVCVYI